MTDGDSDRRAEREWDEHDRDHTREHQVAKETAQRLEREVEQTALRLERTVEETAVRIDKAVSTALTAVAETARVHAEAHAKEHVAHERIHGVEKGQVDKAEESMNKRLEGMNEFRSALQDAAARMVTREVLEQYQKDREQRLQAVIDRIIALEKSQVTEDTVANIRLDQDRQRSTMRLAIAGVLLGIAANFIINLMQGGTP